MPEMSDLEVGKFNIAAAVERMKANSNGMGEWPEALRAALAHELGGMGGSAQSDVDELVQIIEELIVAADEVAANNTAAAQALESVAAH